MPLQPPNPEFLSQAPGPGTGSFVATEPVAAGAPDAMTRPPAVPVQRVAAEPNRATGSADDRFDWRQPAGLAGVAFVLIAAVFGIDLIG
jgi:hypothetical protein